MKQSNLSAPRTLDDACFISGHNPVRRYRGVSKAYNFAGMLVLAGALVVGLLSYFDVLTK